MQKQKCSFGLYTRFLIANQNRCSSVEMSKSLPHTSIAHDAIDRWRLSKSYSPLQLWQHTRYLVKKETGYLICDDSILDKRHSRKNELVKKQYSGNEHGLIDGICLVNFLWTSGEEYVPVDYRVYRREDDGLTKNDHFKNMLDVAKKRGFSPRYILTDSWYSGLDNLKHVRDKEWHFITMLKSNRQVSPSYGTTLAIQDLELADKQVRQVWLRGFGSILVCALIDKNGDRTFLATDDLTLTEYADFTNHFNHRWKIEEFHRGVKQTTGIEQCESIKAVSQRTHIFSAFVAFVKLERQRLKSGISWYEQKAMISRMATRYCLANA
ncbi:MAG: transposase [Candidatus Moraniibacteriota bacterium]|nr:MAG: transposase [Candidatus Moranbacteria bacterium]